MIPGQSPHQWLLWRTKVAEGLTEADAWEFVIRSNSHIVPAQQTLNPTQTQPQNQPVHVQPTAMSTNAHTWSQSNSAGAVEGGSGSGSSSGSGGGGYMNGTVNPSQLFSPGHGMQRESQLFLPKHQTARQSYCLDPLARGKMSNDQMLSLCHTVYAILLSSGFRHCDMAQTRLKSPFLSPCSVRDMVFGGDVLTKITLLGKIPSCPIFTLPFGGFVAVSESQVIGCARM